MSQLEQQQQQQCPDCQSQDIIIEDFISVCTNCGNVVNDEPNLVFQPQTTKDGEKISYSQQQQYHQQNIIKLSDQKRTTAPVLYGIKLISTLSKNLNISKSIREMAITLFRDVCKENEFKNRSTNFKQSLALCCLYVICNQECNHITLNEFFKNSDSVFKHVGKILLSLQKKRPELFEKSAKKIESLIPLYLFKHDFADKEKMAISDYATGLVWMWQEACLIQGFNPITIIYVALFYAWKAVDQKRSSITVNKFCDQFNISNRIVLDKKVRFFFKVLKDFANCCPLFTNSEELTKNTISLRIEKIVYMKRSIIAEYNQLNTNGNHQHVNEQKNNEIISNNNKPITFEEIEDQDFSDEEINSYIRSDHEVEEIRKLSSN